MKSRGNKNWGNKLYLSEHIPNVPPQFELLTKQLRIDSLDDMLRSRTLRDWVYKHYRKRYVPEKLLDAMGIILEPCDVDILL